VKTDCEKAQGYATAVGNLCKKVLRRERAKSALLLLLHCSLSLWRRKAVVTRVESAAAGRVVTVGATGIWQQAAKLQQCATLCCHSCLQLLQERDSDPRKDSCCVAKKGQVSLADQPHDF